jgi:hypothetical protein
MRNILQIDSNVLFIYLDITDDHIIYFETKIYEDIKQFALNEIPLDFRRYIILTNTTKRHLSHIGLHGIIPLPKSPHGSPSKMVRKELKKEM